MSLLARSDAELNVIFEQPHSRINQYMRAADVLLITSLHEGSPNVVKEAMACGLPIVATDVGDIKHNIGDLEGCYTSGNSPQEVADVLIKALDFTPPTKGQARLKELRLTSDDARESVISVYARVLARQSKST
jgi:glycosyltransferase involved in cell wall biosynthesis